MSTTGAPTLSAQSPWPGLRPFGEDDRSFFFGRERETAELHALVQRSVVVVVYGQSGLGKTSLLQAGLFHHLRDVSLLPFRLRIDHGDAAPSASTQIKAALTAALDAAGVQGPRPGPDETLWEYFHRHDVDLWGARNRLIRPVIAFDQFEEVFTLGQRSEKAIARVAGLAADLESLLEHRAPDSVRARLEQRPEDGLKFDFQQEGVKFIISLREDFLAQLDTWRVRMPTLLPNRFRLERMTGAQALDVVQRAGGALVDPAVAKEVVDFVSRSQRRAQTGALQARNVEPALLSVVCDELNRRRLNRKQAQITPDLLSGEREGIIQGFYARAFEDVQPRARDWVEDELLTVSGYRDRAAQEDALRLGIRESDLDALVDRRILHREERDGVVWLELTHDLLTDPAYASRTQREQRRLAEDATRREAETNARLRRTSRLAAGFGVLSLAMVVALFFAFRMSQRAADAQASMQKERDRAVGAEANAGAAAARAQKSAEMAQAEAARASSSFSTAMGMAEPLGQTLREFVLGDMRLMTPAVLDIVTRTDESYRLLEAQDASAPAQRHGEFLVTAAQALYEVGHLSEGVTRAEQALTLLDAHPPPAGTGRALRAEAMYARGAGYAATGRMAQARRDFAAAIGLAGAESRTSSKWTPEMARVNALSEIGLGELDRWTFAYESAEAHYQRVLGFVNAHPLKNVAGQEQAEMWGVQALMGLAMSATGTAEQDRRYARATKALDQVVTRDPDNLRLLKLSAEIGFLRGRTTADLSHERLAAKLSADSNTASEHLTQHDRDNLQWRLTWIRAQRAIGYLDQSARRWAQARTRLEAADHAASELIKADPAWRVARYVHGALLWETAQAYRGEDKSDRAIAVMAQARDEFSAGIRRAPGDLEFVRGVPLALGGMAAAHLDRKDYDETIQLSKQAIQALVPAEKGAPDDSAVQSNKSYYYQLAGLAWAAKSNWKEAIDAYTNRVGILTSLALRTRLASDENVLAKALIDLGDVYDRSGDAAKAIAQYDRAADAVTRALSVDPTDPDTVHHAVLVRTEQLGMLTREQGVPVAFEHAQSASTLVWNALKREAWNHTLQVDLRGINKWLTDLKPIVAGSNLAPATVSSMSSRIDTMLQTRQASLLVDWIIRPLMPGPWRNLTDAEFTTAQTLVHEAYPKIPVDQIFAVRELPLSFRRTSDRLYEAGVESDTGERGIVAFIDKRSADERLSSRFVLLDGTSPPVHQMNSESAPLLDTPARATDYVRFFLGMLNASLGPFAIVEKSEDVLWRPEAPDDVRANAGKRMVPIRLTRQSDGSWVTPCTILYGTSLYSAKLTLNTTGGLKIEDDVTLMNNLPVMIEAVTDHVKALHEITDLYARGLAADLKQLDTAPKDRKILADAVDMNLKLGRLKDAAPLQQRLVAEMAADTTTTKEDLVGAYTSLSWYQLFARDFEAARKAAEEGLKLDPADLYLETNRAHALLFMGKTAEAEAVYRAHLGKKLSPNSSLIWEAAILQDFEDLEKAGVTHVEMARIRKIMARLDIDPSLY